MWDIFPFARSMQGGASCDSGGHMCVMLLQRCGRQPDDLSSIVLVTPDAFHIKSEAILKIGQGLRQPFPVLATPLLVVPLPLRDGIYDQVALHAAASAGTRTYHCSFLQSLEYD